MIKAKAIQASITLKAQASSKIARYKVTEKFKGKERFVESRQRKSSRVAPSRKASLKRGFRNQGKFKRSFKRYSKVAIERCGVLAPKKERKRKYFCLLKMALLLCQLNKINFCLEVAEMSFALHTQSEYCYLAASLAKNDFLTVFYLVTLHSCKVL